MQFDPQSIALTIAGSDPSGGAGLQADLKTFQQLGVYGMSVVTLLTVQNTQAVTHVECLTPHLVQKQLAAVLDDIPPRCIKTGALGNASIIRVVAETLAGTSFPLVVDPVLVSKHGHELADEDAVTAYRECLLPRALMITPNRFEAERLADMPFDSDANAHEGIRKLRALGPDYVLVKLGDSASTSASRPQGESRSLHLLATPQGVVQFDTERLPTNNTHGTGCILAANITAQLAAGSTDVVQVVQQAITGTLEAIRTNTRIGQGIHPAETRVLTPST